MNEIDLVFAGACIVFAAVVLSVSSLIRAIVVEAITHPLRTAHLVKGSDGVHVEVQSNHQERPAHA